MKHRVAILIVLMQMLVFGVAAQTYKFDVGAGVGMSGYLGDANKSNLFKHPGFAANATFRYIMNYRWAFKGSLTYAGLSGNSADYEDYFPGGESVKFNSNVAGILAQAEFNFLNYGIGYKYKRLYRLVPYLTVGVGANVAKCSGNTAFAAEIPMGVGLKFKLKERINLGAEILMHKVFGDKLDNFTLDNLNGIKSSFLKNTDWYSTIMFTISFEFGKRCVQCHYVE